GKTIILGSLYDSWWCQGTADAAIGTSVVLAVAKYFVENKITPKCNIKFIAFGGEEHGFKGTLYYEHAHKNENVKYFIDINQIGFYQVEPRLKLNIVVNNRFLREKIFEITNKSNYIIRIDNVTDFDVTYSSIGHCSNDRVYALKRPSFLPFWGCKTIGFLKEGAWLHHHRDGVNHTKGDVMAHYDKKDVEVTSEMILNVTKYLSIADEDTLVFCSKDFPFFMLLEKYLDDHIKR
ncbi:MAG: M20/M25/M40 family metallo-hydrolase, partial [Epsilonproteobacteria bacterium]|nr:M20/M25/M40 family metallo-hydrolase [Campylobacterota bacterium]